MQPPLADWSPLEMLRGVGHVKLPSIKADGFQTRIQQFSRRPHGGFTLDVFAIARLYTHQND